MRESLMYGSVRGARGNSRPYRDDCDRGLAALHESESVQVVCRFSAAGDDDLATRSAGRRPKSAKARSRGGGWCGGGAAGAMGIWPRVVS